MIAGNETAMAPQPLSVAYWNCGANANVPRSALPPVSCPAGSSLVLSLVFPDCWDGHTLNGKTPDERRLRRPQDVPSRLPGRDPAAERSRALSDRRAAAA